MESQCGEYDITLYDLVISFSLYLQSVSRKTQKHMIQLLNPAAPDFVPLCNIQSATPMPGAWLQDQSSSYLIFVIFFTRAKFLENKIYTEKRQFFALYL